MRSFEEIQKAKIAASFNLDPVPAQLLKAEIDELEKGGKRVPIGTVKGAYIKTSDGWKYHGKGKTGKAQDHVRGALDHHTHKDATDHLVEQDGKHYIDVLSPDTEEKKFKPGDRVRYKDDSGKEYKGTLSNREHPDGDMYEVDKDDVKESKK